MTSIEDGQSHPGSHGQHHHGREFVKSERHHLPWSAKLSPRRQVFYDPSQHGYIVQWSRGLRKNRHSEFVADDKYWRELHVIPRWPVIFKLDFKNVSWHVAFWFTLGSICWIVNGHYFLWPKGGNSDLQVNTNITGYSALCGGLLFWLGAYMAVLEALNERQVDDFDLEVRHIIDRLKEEPRDIQRFARKHLKELKKKGGSRRVVHPDSNPFHQSICHVKYTKCDCGSGCHVGNNASGEGAGAGALKMKWRWFGLQLNSLGWWASVIQFTGATCFTISVITDIPSVLSKSQWKLQVAFIWTMQVVGSICFTVSSMMLMLEEQHKWYLPAIDRIGWHSAAWNTLGGIGFLLSAVFGYLANFHGNGEVCCQFWGTGFNTYYGSWAFLISSVIMLIEVQNKQPTELGRIVNRVFVWIAELTKMESEKLVEEEESNGSEQRKEEA